MSPFWKASLYLTFAELAGLIFIAFASGLIE